ncbi:MAG TPA: hypothetical protein VEL31_20025, partial [Ktedonobacteraceae bacterium]|nr:hypothetical protein [Ktedonobacteraceae bacterium]
MTVSTNYKHLFKSLLDTVSSPVFIVDRALTICYSNQLASRFWTSPSKGDKLDRVISDTAIVQLAQEVISTGSLRKENYERNGISWRVSVTPLVERSKRKRSSDSSP